MQLEVRFKWTKVELQVPGNLKKTRSASNKLSGQTFKTLDAAGDLGEAPKLPRSGLVRSFQS
jgi:hypothetical protein